MSKKTKRLEKENLALSRKSETTNRNLLEMAEERTRHQKELETLKKKNLKLESICRALQKERNTLENRLRAEGEELLEDDGDSEDYEEDSEDLDEGSEEGSDDEGDEDTEEENSAADHPLHHHQPQQKLPSGAGAGGGGGGGGAGDLVKKNGTAPPQTQQAKLGQNGALSPAELGPAPVQA